MPKRVTPPKYLDVVVLTDPARFGELGLVIGTDSVRGTSAVKMASPHIMSGGTICLWLSNASLEVIGHAW